MKEDIQENSLFASYGLIYLFSWGWLLECSVGHSTIFAITEIRHLCLLWSYASKISNAPAWRRPHTFMGSVNEKFSLALLGNHNFVFKTLIDE